MIKFILLSILLNPEFSEKIPNPEFFGITKTEARRRGKQQRGRKRSGGGLR
jgi:hypothetical protein